MEIDGKTFSYGPFFTSKENDLRRKLQAASPSRESRNKGPNHFSQSGAGRRLEDDSAAQESSPGQLFLSYDCEWGYNGGKSRTDHTCREGVCEATAHRDDKYNRFSVFRGFL